MARRSDHSRDEIREMAILAAEKRVNEHGLKGLSARKVATDIGYTVGTLYLVFKNLDELILSINARALDELYQAMEESIAQNQDHKACVISLCHTYYLFATQHVHRWTLMFEHILPEHEHVPEWYSAKVARGFEILEQVLQPVATGLDEVEIARAAKVLWGSVHGISMLAVSDKLGVVGTESVNELLDSLVDNYLRGLVGPD